MDDELKTITKIREAFADNSSPGDPYLQPYPSGYDLLDEIKSFGGLRYWQEAPASLLDDNPDALSYFSETGFRLFLPAYLIADIKGDLECADPLFHLVGGFRDQTLSETDSNHTYEMAIGKSALLNPIQYGAITLYDRFRFRLSVFCREEAQAIVSYLEYKKTEAGSDPSSVADIKAALQLFWYDRAKHAPTRAALDVHIESERAYLDSLKSH